MEFPYEYPPPFHPSCFFCLGPMSSKSIGIEASLSFNPTSLEDPEFDLNVKIRGIEV